MVKGMVNRSLEKEIRKLVTLVALKKLGAHAFFVPSTAVTLRLTRDDLRSAWKGNFRPLGHTTSPDLSLILSLRKVLRHHFDPSDEFVFLGPFVGEWSRAVEIATGKKPRLVDVVEEYLHRPWDPYSSLRIRNDRDVVDVYPIGPGVLTLGGRNVVFIHYEFTPCISNPILCILFSLGIGKGYVHVTSENYDVAEWINELKKVVSEVKVHVHRLGTSKYLWPDATKPTTEVKAYVMKSQENPTLVKAGRLLRHLLSWSPLGNDVQGVMRILGKFTHSYLESLPPKERKKVLELAKMAVKNLVG